MHKNIQFLLGTGIAVIFWVVSIVLLQSKMMLWTTGFLWSIFIIYLLIPNEKIKKWFKVAIIFLPIMIFIEGLVGKRTLANDYSDTTLFLTIFAVSIWISFLLFSVHLVIYKTRLRTRLVNKITHWLTVFLISSFIVILMRIFNLYINSRLGN